ncbi:MAG: 16S rRNA (cytosine(1402)-N(4))-methyltransferase RsmH [Planctomycetes bacterium]|nr:16S rRNA (cytosine(1402)-N(4))-methyltransferase RsmH [Planctomycetota bacterium]
MHEPVLLNEVDQILRPEPGKLIVDATLGLGGHAEAFLERGARVVGIEWDEDAAEHAARRLERFGGALTIVRENFAELPAILDKLKIATIDGLLLDLGVSSLQLDDASRGFSFRFEAPLDMRMSRASRRTAAEVLSSLTEKDLERIFRQYGEEPKARALARELWRRKGETARWTTRELAEFVLRLVGRRGRIHPATRVFQALRIEVNRELDNLKRLLAVADKYVGSGGRIAVISFHSLEDRIVKHALRGNAAWKIVTKKPIRPTREETLANPRSRSAKLRSAERV